MTTISKLIILLFSSVVYPQRALISCAILWSAINNKTFNQDKNVIFN